MTRRTYTSAVIYLRVSTAQQAESGLGLEAQEAACREYAVRQGWAVEGAYRDEGLSGSRAIEQRPGLVAAIDAVRRTGSVLLVYSVSRATRSTPDLYRLVDDRGGFGMPLVSATEPFDLSTAMGRAFMGMMGVLATLEREQAAERTTAALGAARARGQRLGAPSMTERVEDGVRVQDDAMVARVRYVAQLRAEGLSLRAIAARLNAEQVPTKRAGGRWHLRTVEVALQAADGLSDV